MDELTMLRDQMASMKQSLDRSNIINKDLMHKVMRKTSSWLNNTVWMEAITTPIIALILCYLSFSVGISIWFAVIFFIGSAIDTAFDYKTLRIPGQWFSEMDVIVLRKKLLHQKLQRKKQYIISVSGAAIWGGFFGYQYLIHGIAANITPDTTVKAIFIGIVAFLVMAGVWASLVIYRKAQRTNDELVKQIDEFENENYENDSEK